MASDQEDGYENFAAERQSWRIALRGFRLGSASSTWTDRYFTDERIERGGWRPASERWQKYE